MCAQLATNQTANALSVGANANDVTLHTTYYAAPNRLILGVGTGAAMIVNTDNSTTFSGVMNGLSHVLSGSLTAASATVSGALSGTSAVITGALTAATAVISGNTTVSGELILNANNNANLLIAPTSSSQNSVIQMPAGGASGTCLVTAGAAANWSPNAAAGDTVLRNNGGNILLCTGSSYIPNITCTAAGNIIMSGALSGLSAVMSGAVSCLSLAVNGAPVVGMPSGVISQFAGTAAPTGYLLCDGTAYSRTTYAALYTAISTTYGSGDGSTTFNVPNFLGKVAAGYNSNDTNFSTIAGTGGAESVTLATTNLPAHSHSVTDSGHGHQVTDSGHTHPNQYGTAAKPFPTGGTTTTATICVSGTGPTPFGYANPSCQYGTANLTCASTGSGTAFSVMQPYLVVAYIIKT